MEATYKDRKFDMKIPNPMMGCAIFNTLTQYRVPFLPDNFFGVAAAKTSMPPEELERYMNMCLKNVYEKVPGNDKPIAVVDTQNQIAVNNATGPMLMQLVNQYLIFFGRYWRDELGSALSLDPSVTTSQNPQT